MRYIENLELREWVKESLRKTIFQKAHALAVQTGCEILVKLKDAASAHDCPLYYASDSLQQAYRKDGVREEPGEMFVSGETGLPVFPMVDSSTQIISEQNSQQSKTSVAGDDIDISKQSVDNVIESAAPSVDAVNETAVPMQLSLATDSGESIEPKQESQTDDFTTQTAQDSQDNSLSDVVVKLERMDEEELNARLGASDLSEQPSDEQASFEQFDNSVTFDTGQEDTSIGSQPYPIMSPKPYQCGVCGKAFRSVQVLQKHTQTFHMRPQMTGARIRGRGRGLYHARPVGHRQLQASQARYLCVLCNRSFRSPDLLQDHMTRSHMSHATPVQLSTSQGSFDPSSAQTSQAPSTATLQTLQQQQTPGSTFQTPADTSAQFQISQTQSTPSAFNVSAASTSSSTFASPTSTPIFRYRQTGQSSRPSTSAIGTPQAQSTSSPSRVRGRWSQSPVKIHQPVPITKVMTAILRTTGPVLTHIAVRRNGAPIFRKISIEQFRVAANKLQAVNLGTLIEMRLGGGRPSVVFIKKPPAEAHEALEANPGLLNSTEYAQRYNSPLLSSIPPTMCGELLAKGLVPPQFF